MEALKPIDYVYLAMIVSAVVGGLLVLFLRRQERR
jgi:hypothetical protein